MKKFLTCLFFLIWVWQLQGQSVVGKWITYDVFDSSIEEAVVDIRVRDGQLHMRIDSIIPEEHRDDLCVRCTDEFKDQPILGMEILHGARLEDGVWRGARILNAKNGRWYGCLIWPTNGNRLKVRGYIGYPIFGKNLYWIRLEEKTHPH
jgi:uncharacterized protein (DUF2147 family)